MTCFLFFVKFGLSPHFLPKRGLFFPELFFFIFSIVCCLAFLPIAFCLILFLVVSDNFLPELPSPPSVKLHNGPIFLSFLPIFEIKNFSFSKACFSERLLKQISMNGLKFSDKIFFILETLN